MSEFPASSPSALSPESSISTSPAVDLAGARMFLDLHTELAKRGIILRLVEAHASVRDLLRIEGAEDRVGRIDRFATVADAIEHFQNSTT